MELAQYVNKVGELVNQSTKCNVELDKVCCLKKQINFYPEKDIDNDCILTEVEEHIIQE